LRRLWFFFPVLLVFLEGQFNIIVQVVIRGAFAEFEGGSVSYHKAIQFIPGEVGDLEYDRRVKAVVDEFILFLIQEAVLEGEHATCSGKTEYVDQFVEVDACTQPAIGGRAGQFEAGFFEIKDLGVILPVLDGVCAIVTGHDPYFFQFDRVDVEGDVKAGDGVDGADGEPGSGPSQVGKIDGIILPDLYDIVTERIGSGASTPDADDTNGIERTGAVHIVYRSMDRHFLGLYGPRGKEGHAYQ